MILENLGLSFVLFIVYLYFLSWLLETPPTLREEKQDFYSQVSELLAVEAPLNIAESQKSQETQIDTNSADKNQPLVKLSQKSQLTSISLHDEVKEIIENLNFRELRQLCRPLSIQQKRNGVAKSKQLILAEIKRICKEQPDEVLVAITAKIPEKLQSLEIAKIS
ncbi:MAG: hypothetical protein EA365_08840 [Gloeocapsa sp. DLM2.Bin57]|nr:MAG: hypothetical protein EA365_08840 [Gloeocapsa sp. DLM2.Bin57]